MFAAPGVRPRDRRPVPIRRSRSRNIRGRNPARRELARPSLTPSMASPVFRAGEVAEPPLALSSRARKIAAPRPSSPWGIALPPEAARAGRPARRAVAKASARPPGFRTQGWAQVPADLAVSGAVLRPPGFRPRLFVAPCIPRPKPGLLTVRAIDQRSKNPAERGHGPPGFPAGRWPQRRRSRPSRGRFFASRPRAAATPPGRLPVACRGVLRARSSRVQGRAR